MDAKQNWRVLATEVKTLGQLRELLKDFPDETEFAFINQPMQRLEHRTYICEGIVWECVGFQEQYFL